MTENSRLKHLYWRAGFGLLPSEWQARHDWDIGQAIDNLFSEAIDPTPLKEPAAELPEGNKQAFLKQQRKLAIQVNYDWITSMTSAKSSALVEKMCLFWHGHFACTIRSGTLAVRQLNTLREHALGNFRDLLKAIARDPAMIRFLNNQQNRKNAPNENFARELMELFTLGRGNYSEEDIKAAARAFTGWSSNLRGEFIFRRFQHDYGVKSFMGQTGNFDGGDIIDIILEQPAAASFICRKLYAYFVNTEVNETHVQELAKTFRETDYDISTVMRQLLSAEWFYAPENRENRIKSPVELFVGLCRQLSITAMPVRGVLAIQRALGQQLLNPPNVAGWAGGKSWIDNSTLLTRLNLAGGIALASDFDLRLPQDLEAKSQTRLKQLKAEVNFSPLRTLTGGATGLTARKALADYLLVPPPPVVTAISTPDEPALIVLQLLSTPEYQLC